MRSKKVGYFRTSMKTLIDIAESTNDYYMVAGYLVMARHCTSEEIGGREPYTFCGAGQRAIQEKVHVSTARAAGIFDRLSDQGWLKPAAADIKALAPKAARQEVKRGQLDLDLPHTFTDDLGKVDAILARFKGLGHCTGYKERLTTLTDEDAKLDALMLMLHVYWRLDMTRWGGVPPLFFFRAWTTHSRRRSNQNFIWQAEAGPQSMYPDKAQAALSHASLVNDKQVKAYPLVETRFWSALQNLQQKGLVYEAVTWLTDDPKKNDKAQALCTIRVNDYHADTEVRGTTPDPSLLKEIGELGFYTNPNNDRGEEEQVKVAMHADHGMLIGIYRPRFRPINSDTGVWMERDTEACESHGSKIIIGSAL